MAEIASVGLGAQKPADAPSGGGRRMRPPSALRSRAPTPGPARSPAVEESEGDDADPMGLEHPEIRRSRSMSCGRDPSADSRVAPGGSTDLGDTSSDMYRRKELHRRRLESSERLNPLASTPRAPLQPEGLPKAHVMQ